MPRSPRQAGAALLLMLAALGLSVLVLLFYNLSAAPWQVQRQQQTALALAQARAALLGFATAYAQTHPSQPPGYFPCPDTNGDGSADPPCGSKGVSAIGRLPWRTLGMEPLRDGDGECLWYAVSGTYKDNPKALNIDKVGTGLLAVNARDSAGALLPGDPPAQAAIAVIFAPGRALPGQTRTPSLACGNVTPGNSSDPVNQASNHLDSLGGIDNAVVSDATFVSAPESKDGNGAPLFNDSVLVVGRKDWEDLGFPRRMENWVEDTLKTCLQNYADPATPMPDNSPPSLARYPWAAAIDNASYQETNGLLFGRFPKATLNKTRASNGNMPDAWDSDAWGNTCFGSAWTWWADWQDMLFYAVDKQNSPVGPGAGTGVLKLGTAPKELLVIYAGAKRAGQSRASAADTLDINNYLEGGNLPSHPETLTTKRSFVVCDGSTCNDLIVSVP